MTTFASLTAALDGWFDKPLSELPGAIQERVREDFFPMPWDELSAEQRKSVARQWDYHNDPATESVRQYWWDFFSKNDELKKQIEQWSSVAAPTAGELAEKERRLKELHAELALMQKHQERARGDFLQAQVGSTSATPNEPHRYIAYPKALRRLEERLNATPEELAAWVFMGPEQGGIAAYRNANELEPPPRFFFAYYLGAEDYLAPMMACWFLEQDIERFNPEDRYITGKALIERWGKQAGIKAEAFIQAKIEELRLIDLHPIYGGTRGTLSEDATLPPLGAGLFALAHVEAVEAEDFGDAVDEGQLNPSVGTPEWRKRNAQAAADALHNKPGGSREKRDAIRAIWASGKYTSRDLCAEEECAALNMSFSAARNALKNQPKPEK
jgi:hypothetical protein